MVERYHIRSAVATVSIHQVYCLLLTGGKKKFDREGRAGLKITLVKTEKPILELWAASAHRIFCVKASCKSHWTSQHTPAVTQHHDVKRCLWPLRHYFPSMTPIRMAFLIKRRLAELWRNKKEKPFGWNVLDDFRGQVDLNMFVLRLSRATGLFT